MPTMRWWLATATLIASCTPVQRAFHCIDSRSCINGGVQGTCEASGWCSFPDLMCASGRRYGQFAGGALSGNCVTATDSCGTIGEACCANQTCGSALQCVGGVCVGCVSQLAIGGAHGCALVRDGTVACWGRNDHGQLGNGGTSDAAAAVGVVDGHGVRIGGVRAIAAGAAHSCALRGDGTVVCWGDDSSGQLGRGGAAAVNPVPMPAALTSIVAVAAGARHTCAALTNGSVWCWGANDSAQLGAPPSAGASMPMQVVDGAGLAVAAASLAAGDTHTCAVDASAQLACWGSDGSGELGDASTATTRAPVPATSLGKHVRVAAAGARLSCALVDDGSVRCFGAADASPAVVVPTAVAGLDLVTAVAAGGSAVCARRGGGGFYCWSGAGGTPALVRASVGAIGVGAGDQCSARANGVDCRRFGDPHLACP